MSPRIAITLGDPAGIGPEIVLKTLAMGHWADLSAKITVIGDFAIIASTFDQLKDTCALPLADPATIECWDMGTNLPITIGQGNRNSGEASFRYLERGIAGALAGEFDAIVTAPIAKAAWHQAGHAFPGQTEVLAARSGVEDFGMLFVAESPHTGWVWRTLLATVHIPLGQVATTLQAPLVVKKLGLLGRALRQDFGLEQSRVTIVGINPHSGEQGHLGQEERTWLIPLIDQWTEPTMQLQGPVPPDTVWIAPQRAWFYPQDRELGQDAYLAMYHDQGLIPMKLLAFDQCVNCTIGLPFIRTSPDHGTAFDIAGRGVASPHSFAASLLWATRMASERQRKLAIG